MRATYETNEKKEQCRLSFDDIQERGYEMLENLRNIHERFLRWGQHHKTRLWLLCCGLVGGGPALIGILGLIDSVFDYHARIRIV